MAYNISVSLDCFVLFSAKVVVELAKGDFIQAAVLAHPSFVTLDDIKGKSSLFNNQYNISL